MATAAADPTKSAAFTVTVKPTPALVRLSSDPLTNSTSQHATEVEPDTFAFGSTIVTAFQVGRIFSGGAADSKFPGQDLFVVGRHRPLDFSTAYLKRFK
jgi:hypothetical protein